MEEKVPQITSSNSEKMDRKRSANGHIKPLSLSSSTEEMLCDDTKDKKEEGKSEYDLDLSEEESESSMQLGTPSDMLSDDACICFNDNAHIQHVKFVSRRSANTLTGNKTRIPEHFPIEDWCYIPTLAVLTGINGSGKSTILKYLSEITGCNGNHNTENNNKVLYLSADEIPFSNHYYSSQQHYDYLTDHNRFNLLIDACEDYLIHRQAQQGANKQYKKLIQNICGRYEKKQKEEIALSKREVLKRIAREITPTNLTSMKDPFQYLTEAMLMHYERIKGWKEQLRDVKNIRWLHQYYCSQNNFISLDDFAIQLEEQDAKFYSDLLDNAAKHYSGISMLDVVNEVLRKYGFKYQLVSYPDSQDSRKNELKLKAIDDASEYDITTAELSSGERMILTMMSWLYFKEDTQRRLAAGETEEKIKILLLDEPDRHLDPKLCKLFFNILQEEFVKKHKIQVIMSTHRYDSIVYAERNSIFIVQKEGEDRRRIVPSSRMETIFRMTSNIRELTAYERRVYVESKKDAEFYQGVYLTLAQWFEKNSEEKWYPSRRHQLSFQGVSQSRNSKDSGKGEGGSQKVIARILEYNYHSNTTEKKGVLFTQYNLFRLIDEPGLLKSFGILDKDYDYDGTVKRLESKQILDSVVILKRHSLENFCLDPIIFCSVLESIDHYTISLIKKEAYNHVRERFKSIFHNIKKLLDQDLKEESVISNLQMQIRDYFLVLLPIVAMKIWFDTNAKEEDNKRCFSICHNTGLIADRTEWGNLRKDKASLGKRFLLTFGNQSCFEKYLASQNKNYKWTEIKIISKPEEKLVKFSLQYPTIFLELRSHTIEDIFSTNPLPSDDITWAVHDKGLRFIPEDLRASFIELDDRIRENVHRATKPHSSPCPVVLKREMEDSQDTLSLHCLDIHSPSSSCSSSYFQPEISQKAKKRKIETEGEKIPSAGNQTNKQL